LAGKVRFRAKESVIGLKPAAQMEPHASLRFGPKSEIVYKQMMRADAQGVVASADEMVIGNLVAAQRQRGRDDFIFIRGVEERNAIRAQAPAEVFAIGFGKQPTPVRRKRLHLAEMEFHESIYGPSIACVHAGSHAKPARLFYGSPMVSRKISK
jgi:hypothetical protein